MNLRPAQVDVLSFTRGRMAVSAVPGSGKTFILSLLAVQLIADGRLNPGIGQQVLVVTYMNSSVETFRASIRQRLHELELPIAGFDVRTLHSLALEIVREAGGGLNGQGELVSVANEAQASIFLARATDGWIDANRPQWQRFLDNDSPQARARWRDVTERTARRFIREAKNGRYTPARILRQLDQQISSGDSTAASADSSEKVAQKQMAPEFPLLRMMAGIYERYQSALTRLGALDFDDIIWRAVDTLEHNPGQKEYLSRRWPYILEDEAQDSVPLQEVLLELLVGTNGNWVRAGDPNQAITSTFTSAHPKHFNAFLDSSEVQSLPLPNSGRSAPKIFGVANELIDWVCDNHPVPEVQLHAFRRQEILPTPPGDFQPNPSDSKAKIEIKVFSHREDKELPSIALLATDYALNYPGQTLAILVPTNNIGHSLAQHLDGLKSDYDDQLTGGGRVREIAACLHALLALLSNPLDTRALESAYTALAEYGHTSTPVVGVNPDKIRTLFRSVHSPEMLIFPQLGDSRSLSLPSGVADSNELQVIDQFAGFLRKVFDLRLMSADELILAISNELFGSTEELDTRGAEGDLAIAYMIANAAKQWLDMQPGWRLPEITLQVAEFAEGRRHLVTSNTVNEGYKPIPGRITLATHHRAKGMEWDAVFLVGIDGFWIPNELSATFLGLSETFGGDPSAEVVAQLRYVMEDSAGLFPGRTATESAHIELICERLRLLYVGITRSRHNLLISRSQVTRSYRTNHAAEPAMVMGIIYNYLKQYDQRFA